jgi:hypothetical protein
VFGEEELGVEVLVLVASTLVGLQGAGGFGYQRPHLALLQSEDGPVPVDSGLLEEHLLVS